MNTFILTWNPNKWSWRAVDRRRMVRRTASGGAVRSRWSTGNRKGGIVPGRDRLFLLRQGPEPRGIIGSGTFATTVIQDAHWDPTRPGQLANYAGVSWDRVLDDQDVLPLAAVETRVAGFRSANIQAGGVLLPAPFDQQLEQLWASHLGATSPTTQSRASR